MESVCGEEARERKTVVRRHVLEDEAVGDTARRIQLFLEYYENPEANAKAFDGHWFKTGDIVQMTAGGNVETSARVFITSDIAKMTPARRENFTGVIGALLLEHSLALLVDDLAALGQREIGRFLERHGKAGG